MGGTRIFEKSTLATLWRRPSASSRTGAAFGAVVGSIVLLASWMVAGSVPQSESELRLGDGAAWLTSTAFGGISLHDGGDGAAMTNLQVAERGAAFAVEQDGANALVVNDSSGEVVRVDAATWSVTRRVAFAEPGEGLDLIIGAGGSWLARGGSVAPFNAETLDLRAPMPVADTMASAEVADDGSLLFAGLDASSPVRRFTPGAEPTTIDDLTGPVSFSVLTDGVVGLDRDSGAVWLDGSGLVCDSLEVPRDVALVGAGSGRTFLAVANSGSIFVWNPADGCPTPEQFVTTNPGDFGTPVVADGWAVIPDLSTGEVIVVDLDALAIVRRAWVLEAGTTFDLIGEDDSIWFNDPTSATAGLVRPNGDVVEIEKYTDAGDGGFAVAPSADSNADLELAGPGGETDADDADTGEQDEGSLADEDGTTSDEDTSAEESGQDEIIDPPDNAATDRGEPETMPEPNIPGEEVQVTPTPPTVPKEPTTGGPGEVPNPPVVDPPPKGPEVTPEGEEVSIRISQTKVTAEIGDTVDFEATVLSGDPVTFQWSVSPNPGSSGSDDGLRFSRTFENTGLYTVQVVGCDEDDASCDTATRQVQVVDSVDAIPLQVSISGSDEVTLGDEATYSAVVEGDAETLTWTIQDGSPAAATGASVDTTFSSIGSKTITVTAERGQERRTDTITVRVVSEATPRDFVVRCAPRELTEGDTTQCSIDDYSADAFGAVTWTQTSPDGSLATLTPSGGNATLRYEGSGEVAITASATDQDTDTAVSDVDVVTFESEAVAAPEPVISGQSTGEVGETITFNVRVDGGAADSITWSAQGTGASGSGESFDASWEAPGDYVITVEATGDGGTGVDQHSISIGAEEELPCNDDAPLERPSTVVTDTGVGTFRVVVTANKCATADIVWRGGGFLASNQSQKVHTFNVSGLDDTEGYTFSSTVRAGGETKFGSGSVLPPACEVNCTIQIVSHGARIVSPTSVELFANTNVCTGAIWSGDAVNKTAAANNCWFAHTHQNPQWGGSIPVQPGQTYSVTFTATDPDGVLDSASVTFNFTMPPEEEPATGPTCSDVLDSGVDTDGDGLDDACDADADGDGDLDAGDSCPGQTNTGVDADGDGIDAACDPDDGAGGGDPTGPTCADVLDSGVDADGDGIDAACDPDDGAGGGDPTGPTCADVLDSGVDADGDGIDAACDPDDGDSPPVDPPTEEPPTEEPPTEEPPTEEPPTEDPPADDPPAEDPPADDPPADGGDGG